MYIPLLIIEEYIENALDLEARITGIRETNLCFIGINKTILEHFYMFIISWTEQVKHV